MNGYWLRSWQVCTIWMRCLHKAARSPALCSSNLSNQLTRPFLIVTTHIMMIHAMSFFLLLSINVFFHITANKHLHVSLYLTHIVCYFRSQRCTYTDTRYSSLYAWINFCRIVKRMCISNAVLLNVDAIFSTTLSTSNLFSSLSIVLLYVIRLFLYSFLDHLTDKKSINGTKSFSMLFCLFFSTNEEFFADDNQN